MPQRCNPLAVAMDHVGLGSDGSRCKLLVHRSHIKVADDRALRLGYLAHQIAVKPAGKHLADNVAAQSVKAGLVANAVVLGALATDALTLGEHFTHERTGAASIRHRPAFSEQIVVAVAGIVYP